MKTKTEIRNTSWMRFRRTLVSHLGVLYLCLLAINGAAQTNIVTDCTEAALRTAMAEGGTVTFACDGIITLTDTIANQWDTTLDGSGHNITISGGNAVRVLYNSTNTGLSLINLTVGNGRCTNGAGIFNDGGTVSLSNVSFETNVAYVDNGESFGPEGGAIYNRVGTVSATNCNFFGNAAGPPPQYQCAYEARGGAIRNEGGFVCLKNCLFTGNTACGGIAPTSPYGSAPPGPNGVGGAIYNDYGASVVSHKRLELFSLVFSHSGAGATGLDSLQGLFATVQFLNN